jgi:lysozyme
LIEELAPGFGAAPTTGVRPIQPLALDLIKHFEGWFPEVYDDPVGYCTVGYGHLLAFSPCSSIDTSAFSGGLTLEKGEDLLEADTSGARYAVQRLVTADLNDEQFGALTSFVFNLGRGNFSKSTLLRLINIGEYDRASSEFGRWVLAGGRVLPGLEIRRACERALFVGSLKYGPNGEFSRDNCMEFGAAPIAGELIDIYVGE